MLSMPTGAKRISSRMTGFYKRVFPVFWSVLTLSLAVFGLAAGRSNPLVLYQCIFMALLFGAIGFIVVRLLLRDLMDEVWDNGKELIVVNDGHVEHVPLSGIVNINYSGFTNPKRATLQLRHPGRWGVKLTFIPVRSALHFNLNHNETIDDLIERVDEARRAS